MLNVYILQKKTCSWTDMHIVIASNENELRDILAKEGIDLDNYFIEDTQEVKAGYITSILE